MSLSISSSSSVLPNQLQEVQHSGESGVRDQARTTEKIVSPSGSLAGREVRIGQSPSKSVEAIQSESLQRLRDMPAPKGLAKVFNVVSTIVSGLVAAPIKLAALAVGGIGALVVGGIAKLGSMIVGADKQHQADRAETRRLLGQVPDDSVLNTRTPSGKSVEQVLDDFRVSHLGGRISQQDMRQYVAMGERIVKALNNAPAHPIPHRLDIDYEADDGSTQTMRIKPNLETTRAISWYLQAKALVDNAGTGQDILLKEGAMIAKDPGNKLYNFLRSSENAYGRVSSHMQERSDSVDKGPVAGLKALFKGGFSAMLGAGLKGQPLQYGIEDFDSRMPSKGGTLLFDKLKSSTSGGAPEIYLKWEAVGMPTTFNFMATHDNDSLGDAMLNRAFAIGRCLKHTINFVQDANPATYRGEKMDKGDARLLLNDFKTLVQDLNIDQGAKDALVKSVGKFGAAHMASVLGQLLETEEVQGEPDKQEDISELLDRLNAFMGQMGSDLGIARKGNEVHVSLS